MTFFDALQKKVCPFCEPSKISSSFLPIDQPINPQTVQDILQRLRKPEDNQDLVYSWNGSTVNPKVLSSVFIAQDVAAVKYGSENSEVPTLDFIMHNNKIAASTATAGAATASSIATSSSAGSAAANTRDKHTFEALSELQTKLKAFVSLKKNGVGIEY